MILPSALRPRPTVLAFIDLVQDIDVIAPVLQAIRADGRLGLRICVSRWLERESPRTAALLTKQGFRFAYVRRHEVIAGRAPSLRGVRGVISVSESSHPAHAAAHALARRARESGLRTYALQHGFENLGLFGLEADAAGFASESVFCWFPEGAVPPELSSDTRSRLVHVGRPQAAAGPAPTGSCDYDVGVFENLHWDRYDDADRAAFREGLLAMARALPHARILLRTHPAGGWADQRFGHELAQMENITRLGAPEGRQRLEAGADVLRGVARVITTPSTIALDAAQAERPVALAAAGGGAYEPLPVLHGPEAWIAFASGQGYDPTRLDLFRSRVLVPGDGAPRIVERLSRDFGESRPQPHD